MDTFIISVDNPFSPWFIILVSVYVALSVTAILIDRARYKKHTGRAEDFMPGWSFGTILIGVVFLVGALSFMGNQDSNAETERLVSAIQEKTSWNDLRVSDNYGNRLFTAEDTDGDYVSGNIFAVGGGMFTVVVEND